MSRFHTNEVIIRMTRERADGTVKTVELGINSDQTLDEIFEAAHRRTDGEMPRPCDFEDKHLWQAAWRLRQAEDELHAPDEVAP